MIPAVVVCRACDEPITDEDECFTDRPFHPRCCPVCIQETEEVGQ